MTFIYFLTIFLFLFLCLLLCASILIQEGKGGGLGAAFGGDSGNAVFGTATADILKKVTAWLVAFFLGTCVILSFWTSTMGRSRGLIAAPHEMTTDVNSDSDS
jgi:preprotein translocase subunit SecG